MIRFRHSDSGSVKRTLRNKTRQVLAGHRKKSSRKVQPCGPIGRFHPQRGCAFQGSLLSSPVTYTAAFPVLSFDRPTRRASRLIFCAGNSPDLTLCRCASGSSSIRPSGDPLPMWLCPDSDFTSCRSRIKLHLPQCRSFADAALSRLGFHKLSLIAAPVVRMRTCMKKMRNPQKFHEYRQLGLCMARRIRKSSPAQ